MMRVQTSSVPGVAARRPPDAVCRLAACSVPTLGLALFWSLTLGCEGLSAGTGGPAVAEPVPVKTVRPQKVDLRRTTTQPGTVHAFHEAELFAQVAGYVRRLHVDIGAEVESGQELAEIDVPEIVKHCEQQRAEVARLQWDVARLEAQADVSQARLGEVQAELKEAESRVMADKSEYTRVSELVETKAVTQSVRDETLQRLAASEAALASKEARYRVTQAELKAARTAVQCGGAAKDVAQRQLERLEVLAEFAILRAPFQGIITQRNIDPGDLVHNAQNSSPGERPPLLTVARIDRVRVRVAVPERDAVWVDAGDPVRFETPALPSTPLQGEVTRFSRRLDPATRTMLVEVELPNPERKLLPGMFGQVTIALEERPASLVLPAGSVRYGQDGSGAHVYIVDTDNTVQHLPVATGLDDGSRIEILSGLSGEERVVTGMLGRLTTNQRVRVLN